MLVAVVIVTVWCQSDEDLRARTRAVAAAGFPTSGVEMGRQSSAEARCRLRERLDALMSSKPFRGYFGVPHPFAVPGTPLPESLGTYLAGKPAAQVAEMREILDDLEDKPMVLDVNFSMSTRA
ncbi:MAG TPA: hypothetical protein VHX44_18620, partial [Planctomycetota bacterium]|nr:hypothetical protein [Planctomycetota bacterium]